MADGRSFLLPCEADMIPADGADPECVCGFRLCVAQQQSPRDAAGPAAGAFQHSRNFLEYSMSEDDPLDSFRCDVCKRLADLTPIAPNLYLCDYCAELPSPRHNEAYRALYEAESAIVEIRSSMSTFLRARNAGTLDELLGPLLQRISGDITAESSWDIIAEFFHIPADVYRARLLQRIGVEAAIEQRVSNEDLATTAERRTNNIDMDTFYAVAGFCVDELERQLREQETATMARVAELDAEAASGGGSSD